MSENRSPADEQPIDPWMVERLTVQPAAARDDDERTLAILFTALRSPAAAHEFAREQDYLAAFTTAQTLRTDIAPNRRKPMFATLLAAKLGVAAAALATIATGAAAYAGTLPTTLQDVAHHTIGAPAAHKTHHPNSHANQRATAKTPTAKPTGSSNTGAGPDATGPAAYGLCTAYTHGGLATTSTAYQSLSKAAGGTDQIKSFCATVPRPSNTSPTSPPAGPPKDHPTGSKTDHPPGPSTDHPTATPGDHPTGPPSNHPTG
jgi:hypothetical protein